MIKKNHKSDSNKIVIKSLSKTFGDKNVLHDINLEIKEGESLAVIGESGSGKSVLIKCISGLLLPDQNSQILIDGKDYSKISIAERANDSIKLGILFQNNALFDSMSIWENVAFALLYNTKMSKKEAKEAAKEKLKMVELDPNIADNYPSEISGGMQKRVALARAIAYNPKLIFFDEPTSGLDPITSRKISELIRRVSQEVGATTITITHDLKCMKIVADNVAVIGSKQIVWHGSLEQLSKSKNEYVNEFINA